MPAARDQVALHDASGQGVGWPGMVPAATGPGGRVTGDAGGCDDDTPPTRAVVYQPSARARVVVDSDTR